MPAKPVAVLRYVIEYCRSKSSEPDKISKLEFSSCLTMMVTMNPTIRTRYIKLAVDSGILEQDPNDGELWRVNWTRLYSYGS